MVVATVRDDNVSIGSSGRDGRRAAHSDMKHFRIQSRLEVGRYDILWSV